MPSTSTRRSPRRAPVAPAPVVLRSRHLGRGFSVTPTERVRPIAAPFAAVFGLLVAVEDGYLGWLLWSAAPGWGQYLLVPAVLGVGALTGAVLVLRGRSLGRWLSGSAVLALFAWLPLLGLLGLVVLFAFLGGGQTMWWSLLLLVGPIGCLKLCLQRPVRTWTRRRRRRRGGRRIGRGVARAR